MQLQLLQSCHRAGPMHAMPPPLLRPTLCTRKRYDGNQLEPMRCRGSGLNELFQKFSEGRMAKKKHKVPELRHAQFIDAARHEFGKNGFHATTIPDIAKRANVSVGLLYHYFEDKERLLFFVLSDVLDKYLKSIQENSIGRDPLSRFRSAVRAYCQIIDKNADATVMTYREIRSLTKAHREAIEQKEIASAKVIEKYIEDCVQSGDFGKINTQLFADQVTMFCHSWGLKAWRFRTQMTVDEYIERGLGLLLHSVLVDDGAGPASGAQRRPPK